MSELGAKSKRVKRGPKRSMTSNKFLSMIVHRSPEKRKSSATLDKEEQERRETTQRELEHKIKSLSNVPSKIRMESYNHSIDHYFLRNVLTPYLYSVYSCLI
jgi:hypothetical protein